MIIFIYFVFELSANLISKILALFLDLMLIETATVVKALFLIFSNSIAKNYDPQLSIFIIIL